MSVYLGDKKIKNVGVLYYDGQGAAVTGSNIKTGVTILNVDGTYTASGTQSAGYTLATSNDIVAGKSAWANGSEVLGTLVTNNYYYGSNVPADSFGNDGDVYLRTI